MLSSRAKKALKIACPQGTPSDNFDGGEIASAIDANSARVSADVLAIATADASDLATAITLTNANKAKINEILAALKAAGLML